MGTLGRRLAMMFSTRGGEIHAYDNDKRVAEEGAAYARETVGDICKTIPGGTPGRVVIAPDLASAVEGAWLVIEAVLEEPDLKTEIFGELDRLASPGAILTTNSSSFKSSEMIGKVTRPERVLNMHFYIPPKMRSVELMTCGKTDEAYISFLKDTLPRWGFPAACSHEGKHGPDLQPRMGGDQTRGDLRSRRGDCHAGGRRCSLSGSVWHRGFAVPADGSGRTSMWSSISRNIMQPNGRACQSKCATY